MATDQTPVRKPYPSDLTDEEWRVLKRYVPAPKPGPNPWKYTRREILNAIRYKLRTGCGWRHLPHDLPHWKTASDYFYLWRDDGTWQRLNDVLRRRLRRAMGRHADASFGVIDTQSVPTTSVGGDVGYDAGKRRKGRKRHVVVDIVGLLLAALVTAASVSDQARIPRLTFEAKAASPRLRALLGDNHYRGPMAALATAWSGVAIQSTTKSPTQRGFVPIPQRWHVEQSFGWMNHWRELSKEYTRNPESSVAWIRVGFIGLMTTRLARIST
jgi:putative transposase